MEVEPNELFGAASRIQGAVPREADPVSLAEIAGAAGRGDVAQAIESFADRWSYGLSCMNQDALHLADLLGRAGQLYTTTESGVTAAER